MENAKHDIENILSWFSEAFSSPSYKQPHPQGAVLTAYSPIGGNFLTNFYNSGSIPSKKSFSSLKS
jgi:hypothetical protein